MIYQGFSTRGSANGLEERKMDLHAAFEMSSPIVIDCFNGHISLSYENEMVYFC